MRDIAARLDKSGEKFDSTAISLVAEKNPLIGMMPMKEANDGTSNKTWPAFFSLGVLRTIRP